MIHIIDDWYINANKYCYQLGQLNPSRITNEEIEDDNDIDEDVEKKQNLGPVLLNMSYHNTVTQAATHLVRYLQKQKVKKTELMSIDEAVKELNKIQDTVETKFKEICTETSINAEDFKVF